MVPPQLLSTGRRVTKSVHTAVILRQSTNIAQHNMLILQFIWRTIKVALKYKYLESQLFSEVPVGTTYNATKK